MSESTSNEHDHNNLVEWIVDEGSPRILAEILQNLRISTSAAEDGRVFINRRRVTDPLTRVSLGARVRAFPSPSSARLEDEAYVLDKWPGVIAAYKPAGLPTVPDQRGNSFHLSASLREIVGEELASRLQASSRLDTLVSGVVLLTHTKQAAEHLSSVRKRGQYGRHYVAIALGHFPEAEGRVTAPIGRARDPRKRQVGGRAAKPASTRYAVVATTPHHSLVAVELDTGRTHQIRVHMRHMGCPLLGDPLYGRGRDVVLDDGTVLPLRRVALHAAWVRVPRDGRTFELDAPVPLSLRELWRRLGGQGTDWDKALRGLADHPEIMDHNDKP